MTPVWGPPSRPGARDGTAASQELLASLLGTGVLVLYGNMWRPSFDAEMRLV
jgi:hypothetical protein